LRATVQARLDNLVVTQVAEEAPPAAPTHQYDGTWNGKTTEGRANDFVVRNDAVAELTIDYQAQSGPGSACSISGVISDPVVAPARIEGDRFSVVITTPISLRSQADQQLYPATKTVRMTGGFQSPTAAAGETEVTVESN